MPDLDVIVIGAGVIGLAIGREFALRGHEVMILERNARSGLETSSRNSGVIHAGLYYPPGSLKATLCIEGRNLLYTFCAENDVDALRCGKILVAGNESEVGRLNALCQNARANGVDDLRMLSSDEVRELEPALRCEAGCLSPSTGVVDTVGLVQALEGHLNHAGGQVVSNTRAIRIEAVKGELRLQLESNGEQAGITCNKLINSAGHGAPGIAATLDHVAAYTPPEGRYAIGHYYGLNRRADFSHLVYPMPDGAWLGVHLTLDTQGAVRFGPDQQWLSGLDYTFEDSSERRGKFAREIRRYWPELDEADLIPDQTGIRPKIYAPGEPPPDFTIHGPAQHGVDNLVHLFGMESPGLTASLAIAKHVASIV